METTPSNSIATGKNGTLEDGVNSAPELIALDTRERLQGKMT